MNIDFLAASLTLVAILAVVGGLPAWAIGLRGFSAVALSPAFAVTLIGGSAVVAPWVGLRWSLLPVAIVTVIVSGAIYLTRRLIERRRSAAAWTTVVKERRADVWLSVAITVAVVLMSVRVLQTIQAPGNISQTFDNIFHLNAVRFVLDTANASSLHVGSMTSPAGTLPFYPAAWHALVSLGVQLTSVSIPVAINAAALVTSAVIWPLGALLLTRTLFGTAPAITLAAGILAVSVPAFPLLAMDYGVLYPFQLGLALVPAGLTAALVVTRIAAPRSPRAAGWWALVLVGVVPGMALAHPGGFVAWLALSAPIAAVFIWRLVSRARGAKSWMLIGAGSLVYVAVGFVLVRVLRPPAEARGWPPQMSIAEAAWQVLSLSVWYLVPAALAAIGVIAGIVWAVIDRKAPGAVAIGMYLIAALLFVTVAALPLPAVRDALTGSWYNNLPRLASILAIAALPISAYGWGRSWQALIRIPAIRRASGTAPTAVRFAVVAIIAVAFAVGANAVPMNRAVAWASPLYRLDDSSPLLSIDEYTLLARLDQHVPEGVLVAGSPWTGAGLAYALGDRTVLMPHALMEISESLRLINDELESAAPGGSACQAIRDLNVGFVLDFGVNEVHPGTHPLEGLDELGTSDRVRLVDSVGDAKLYEIVGCGR